MQAIVYHAAGRRTRRGDSQARVRRRRAAGEGRRLRRLRHRSEELPPRQPADQGPAGMGHEFTGLVEQVGRGAEGFAARRPRGHGHLGFLRRVLLLPPRLEQPLPAAGADGLQLSRRHGRVHGHSRPGPAKRPRGQGARRAFCPSMPRWPSRSVAPSTRWRTAASSRAIRWSCWAPGRWG